MRSFRLAALALVVAPLAAHAQKSDKGAFVVTLGTDTIAVEQFELEKNTLEGDILTRSPFTRVAHYTLTLARDGSPTHFDIRVKRPDGKPLPAPFSSHIVIDYRSDSIVTMVTRDSTRRVASPAIAGAIPFLGNSYAMYEVATRRMMSAKADSMDIAFVQFGNATANTFAAKRMGDSVYVSYFGYPLYLRVDRAGNITGVNAQNTTVKVGVKRLKTVHLEELAEHFSKLEAAGKGLGAISARDTVNADIGTTHIWVDYGRPFKRGRVIFGNVVKLDSIWRTGANAATQFKTSSDLVINGVTVPAGMYTLWTVPSANGATLVFNSQTGQWGTEYDQAKDAVRIPITTTTLSSPVEEFTIAVVPSGATGGTMTLSWDTVQMNVPFTVK